MDKFETIEDYQISLKEFNERTRKSYEDFIQEHGDDSQKLQLRCTPYTEKKGRYGVASLDFGFQIWQSRQSEFDAMTEALLNQTQLLAKKQAEVDQLKNLLEKDEHAHNLYYENANLQTLVEEKDKRINQALNFINNWWHPDLDQKLFVEALGKALRGEREA